MEIQISFQKPIPQLEERKIKRKMEKVLKDLGCDDRELSILFTDDQEMSELNSRYRAKEGTTNVLAFAMDESGAAEEGCLTPRSAMLGDVVISLDRAQQESAEFGETLQQRVEILLVHGVLHLVGYDHERNEEEALLMEGMEKRLLELIGRTSDEGRRKKLRVKHEKRISNIEQGMSNVEGKCSIDPIHPGNE